MSELSSTNYELFVPILGIITLIVVIGALFIGVKLEGRIANPDRSYKKLSEHQRAQQEQ